MKITKALGVALAQLLLDHVSDVAKNISVHWVLHTDTMNIDLDFCFLTAAAATVRLFAFSCRSLVISHEFPKLIEHFCCACTAKTKGTRNITIGCSIRSLGELNSCVF